MFQPVKWHSLLEEPHSSSPPIGESFFGPILSVLVVVPDMPSSVFNNLSLRRKPALAPATSRPLASAELALLLGQPCRDTSQMGEAYDGEQVVRKIEALRPDLVLLDLGLPTLNGFEATWIIHKTSPTSKIIFVRQESSPDVVREAFSLRACGYVLKSDMRDHCA